MQKSEEMDGLNRLMGRGAVPTPCVGTKGCSIGTAGFFVVPKRVVHNSLCVTQVVRSSITKITARKLPVVAGAVRTKNQ